MTRELREIFEQAGCEGALCVRPVQGDGEIVLDADRPAVQASVFKVQIALEVETAFADGRLDGRERVTLGAAERTDGPVGMSLFEDETVLSLRDLVVLMLTISDNPATDVLLGRVGVDALNATAARLGLSGTLVTSDLRTMLDTIGEDLGRADWADLQSWAAGASAADQVWVDEQLPTVRAMDPSRGTRTTPRDMVALLRLIWTDRAGPAAACARVRGAMARQLTRHRIGSGFRPPVRVAAKSGSLSAWSATRSAWSPSPTAASTRPRSSPAPGPARTTPRSAGPSAPPPPGPSPPCGMWGVEAGSGGRHHLEQVAGRVGEVEAAGAQRVVGAAVVGRGRVVPVRGAGGAQPGEDAVEGGRVHVERQVVAGRVGDGEEVPASAWS
ncbi:serine hydrolase [Kitasatospora griseola]|uniref:serine hydrolase n=1 Tax=Kitasatospora griseola TaxID=2064 RepID=UPI0006988450|nr:serine hydrolase [Kitasatospora griseola]